MRTLARKRFKSSKLNVLMDVLDEKLKEAKLILEDFEIYYDDIFENPSLVNNFMKKAKELDQSESVFINEVKLDVYIDTTIFLLDDSLELVDTEGFFDIVYDILQFGVEKIESFSKNSDLVVIENSSLDNWIKRTLDSGMNLWSSINEDKNSISKDSCFFWYL